VRVIALLVMGNTLIKILDVHEHFRRRRARLLDERWRGDELFSAGGGARTRKSCPPSCGFLGFWCAGFCSQTKQEIG
jgi:hypothetical protein